MCKIVDATQKERREKPSCIFDFRDDTIRLLY